MCSCKTPAPQWWSSSKSSVKKNKKKGKNRRWRRCEFLLFCCCCFPSMNKAQYFYIWNGLIPIENSMCTINKRGELTALVLLCIISRARFLSLSRSLSRALLKFCCKIGLRVLCYTLCLPSAERIGCVEGSFKLKLTTKQGESASVAV